MRLEYVLTNEDIKISNYAYALHRGMRKIWLVTSIVGILIFGIAVFGMVGTDNIVITLSFVFLLVFSLVIPLLEPLSRWQRSQNAIKSIPLDERRFSFTFTEDSIQYDNQDLFSVKYSWELVKFVGDYRDVFLICPKSDVELCHVLPKRAFQDERDLETFMNLLRQKEIVIKPIK